MEGREDGHEKYGKLRCAWLRLRQKTPPTFAMADRSKLRLLSHCAAATNHRRDQDCNLHTLPGRVRKPMPRFSQHQSAEALAIRCSSGVAASVRIIADRHRVPPSCCLQTSHLPYKAFILSFQVGFIKKKKWRSDDKGNICSEILDQTKPNKGEWRDCIVRRKKGELSQQGVSTAGSSASRT